MCEIGCVIAMVCAKLMKVNASVLITAQNTSQEKTRCDHLNSENSHCAIDDSHYKLLCVVFVIFGNILYYMENFSRLRLVGWFPVGLNPFPLEIVKLCKSN